MKWILFLLIPHLAHAGFFVEKSMYVTTYLAIGRGKTLDEARADALSAIPKGNEHQFFEVNSKWNSPQFQCMNEAVWLEDKECWGNEIQYTLPLRKVEQ